MTRTHDAAAEGSKWAVVLAVGEGERMRPFIERWTGTHRPKQYCSFTGRRTMLEHTFDRALDWADPKRVVTVLGQGHRAYLESPRKLEVPGLLLEQPRKRDTGPGVFLPLTYILARDPEAVVAIFPSDHFIHPRERFKGILNKAYDLAQRLPGQLVLLSARPERDDPGYGWIQPGARLKPDEVFMVSRFLEKPESWQAAELYRAGGLLNTFIIVARAATLWNLGWGLLPSMMSRFAAVQSWIDSPQEAQALDLAYEGMETVNFSRDILERLADWTVTMPMEGVEWQDWGTPERLVEGLERWGLRPNFPRATAAALSPWPAPAVLA